MKLPMLIGLEWQDIEVPDAVIDAAQTLSRYFDDNDIQYWQLNGVCDRKFAHHLLDIADKINTTINDY